MYGIIYKITNKSNGNSYIGKTTKSLEERFKRHCRENGCTAIRRAIKKYGKNTFEIKILAKCETLKEMNHREQYCIKLFNTLAPNGYNLNNGGEVKQISLETVNKMSEVKKGSRNPMFGRIGANKGKPGFMLGKSHTNDTRIKMSKAKKEMWRKRKQLNTKRAIWSNVMLKIYSII